MDWVINANAMARSIAQPDLTIFIDIAPQTSMLRINEGRNSTELYENLENLTKVRALYLQAIERFKDTENIVVFDGNMPVQELHEAIWQKVKTLIK
jgi:dTMP kinase